MIAKVIQVAVLPEPLDVSLASGHSLLQAVQGRVGPAGQRVDAADVVEEHRLIGLQGQGPFRPPQATLRLPQADQSVGRHVERPCFLRMVQQVSFRRPNAAPPDSRRLLGALQAVVDLPHQQRRLVVVGIDDRGVLEQLRGGLQIALGEAVAGVEVVGLEQLRVEIDGPLEGCLGLLVPPL